MSSPELLRLESVSRSFPVRGGLLGWEQGRVRVLDGVDITVTRGETLGLVGESGCGKSTLAKLIMRLLRPCAGEIRYEGRPITSLGRDYYRHVRMIFQDPYSSLNPRLRVGPVVAEIARIAGASRCEARQRAHHLLAAVGLIGELLNSYPHQLSGGQRQRVAIARALMAGPQLLIADEPVSALDLATQAQILDLLASLRSQHSLTILFISHDLTTVSRFCDRVAVMYLGTIVELLPAPRLLVDGAHPYLRALINSMPTDDPERRSAGRQLLTGEVPGSHAIPPGCPFHPRCPRCTTICELNRPPLELRTKAHQIACHHPDGAVTTRTSTEP